MPAQVRTLLCIDNDVRGLIARRLFLKECGYSVLTATNGREGLRLFALRPVDAVVLDYYMGLLNGDVVATEMKRVRPHVPIVLLSEKLELPSDALKSVDAFLTKSDGPQMLLATLDFVLKPQASAVPHCTRRRDKQIIAGFA